MGPEKLNVVILGPMADVDGQAGRVPVSEHLGNISTAVSELSREMKEEGRSLRLVPITAEKNIGGNIPDFVLMHIEQADFAIADISVRSPNTFYELAIVHSLGIPTICIDYSWNVGDPPFYLNHQRIIGVSDFTVENLTDVIGSVLRQHVGDSGILGLRTNIIEQFYDNPLVDASIASGLATGYFMNGIRRFIQNETGIIPLIARMGNPENRHLEKVVVVRPTGVGTLDSDKRRIDRLPGFKRDHQFKMEEWTRPFTFASAGRYIIDYPTPIPTIASSASYIKIKRTVDRLGFDEIEVMQKLERKYIDAFFAALRKLARDTQVTNETLLAYKTVDELETELDA